MDACSNWFCQWAEQVFVYLNIVDSRLGHPAVSDSEGRSNRKLVPSSDDTKLMRLEYPRSDCLNKPSTQDSLCALSSR